MFCFRYVYLSVCRLQTRIVHPVRTYISGIKQKVAQMACCSKMADLGFFMNPTSDNSVCDVTDYAVRLIHLSFVN